MSDMIISLPVAGGEHVGRVTGRMAGSGDRGQARHDLLVRLVALHVLGDGAEDAADALEAALHALGRLVHPGIVHPELPFGGRHHHFGIREHGRAVLAGAGR